MRSTRPLWQLEERVRNHLKLVSNTILAIMRPGCLILTATILRSSIKASCRQNHRLALWGIRQSSLAGPEPVQRARYVRDQVVRLLQANVEANEASFEIPVRPP